MPFTESAGHRNPPDLLRYVLCHVGFGSCKSIQILEASADHRLVQQKLCTHPYFPGSFWQNNQAGIRGPKQRRLRVGHGTNP